ncbi:MAG TPA: hypothetical protein VF146_10525 [Bryobacteraceae bacterium]
MRAIILFLITGVLLAQAPGFQPVGSVSQVMISITYPASDAIFYVERNPPKTEKDWNDLQAQALILAESGNLLLMGSRARDQGDWIKESQELVAVGAAAYKAALAKDLPAILALNQRLSDACVVCHQQYRPNYRRRKKE